MGKPLELYNLLLLYAKRIKSPTFYIRDFSVFLGKYARQKYESEPKLAVWVENTERRVSDVLANLSQEGSVLLSSDEKGRKIYIGAYCLERIQGVWQNREEKADQPFPDEVNLGFTIPHNSLRTLAVDLDFITYLDAPQSDDLPILKIRFPEGFGSFLALTSFVPKRLLETALIKVRHYLRSENNRDYLQKKLLPAFPGKETQLKSMFTLLMARPYDAQAEIEQAGDFSFLFWSYMNNIIKADIRKKNELLSEDYAIIQSVFVVEAIGNWYKSRVQKKKEIELALKNLDIAFQKAPFAFSLEDILKFSDSKGAPLLGQYSREHLDKWLEKQCKKENPNELPLILQIHNQDGELIYIKKDKILPLVARLISDARPRVKAALTKHWYSLVQTYRKEAAMEEDAIFERTLAIYIAQELPLLSILLKSKYLLLAYLELEIKQPIPENSRIFKNSELIPLSELLLLQRKKVLADVQMLLPFWYSIPIFFHIIAFFKKLSRKPKPVKEKTSEEKIRKTVHLQKSQAHAIRQQGKKILPHLLIEGKNLPETMDVYLEIWNRNLNPVARKNLTEDVQALVRDYLRKTIRYLKAEAFTLERIQSLAETLCNGPSLIKIPQQDALQRYIELYMIQLVL